MQTVCAGEQLCSEACQIAHDKARTELRQRRSPGCPYTQVCAPSSPMHQLLCNKQHTLRQSPYTATPHRLHSFFPNALVVVQQAAHFQTSTLLHCNTTQATLLLSRCISCCHSLGPPTFSLPAATTLPRQQRHYQQWQSSCCWRWW
jgi:hypothetical protein